MPELSIRKIIEKTLSGEIRIPSFQRGFVWEPEKVAFFIDSLYKGYPIGSLLFWRTNIRLENERQLGNYSLPEPTKGYPLDYVLDGQQRITSIFSVFQTELTAVSTVSSWMDIYYILGSSVESQQSQFVPLDANNVDAKKHFPYDSGHSLEHPQVSLLVDAMVEEELLQSTKDGYTDRTIFSLELNKRIELIIKKYTKVRKAIGILCFSRGSERLTQETSILLDLQDKFEGRFLKPDFDWTVDIGKPVQDFLRENTEVQQAYQIMLEAHGSIAFAAGRVFDTKSGVDICPVQKTILGPEIWEFDKCDRTQYQNWKVEHIARDEDTFDTALILNVRHNICSDVERYLKEQGVHVGRIINFSPEDTGSTGFSIQNGTHSSKLAMEVYAALAGRSTVERRAYLHIFAAAPNAFMFHLGQVSRPFGKCILYEYDFEQRGNCSYIPSIQFDGKGGLE